MARTGRDAAAVMAMIIAIIIGIVTYVESQGIDTQIEILKERYRQEQITDDRLRQEAEDRKWRLARPPQTSLSP